MELEITDLPTGIARTHRWLAVGTSGAGLSENAERLNGLRWRLRATRALWRLGATPDAVVCAVGAAIAATGRSSRSPSSTSPSTGERLEGDAISVRGWLFFPEAATARVEVFLGGRSLGLARIGAPRLDVAEVWDDAARGRRRLRTGRRPRRLGRRRRRARPRRRRHQRRGRAPRAGAGPSHGRVAPGERPRPLSCPRRYRLGGPASQRPHVLVVTHQLTLGGAQLYLLDLLRELVRTEVASFTMVTAIDGAAARATSKRSGSRCTSPA